MQPQRHPIIIKIYTVLYVTAHHITVLGQGKRKPTAVTNSWMWKPCKCQTSWFQSESSLLGFLLFFPRNLLQWQTGSPGLPLLSKQGAPFGVSFLCVKCMCATSAEAGSQGLAFWRVYLYVPFSHLSPCVLVSRASSYFSRMHCSIAFCEHSKACSRGSNWDTSCYSSCMFPAFSLVEFHSSIKIHYCTCSGLSNTTLSPHNLPFPRPLAHPEIFFFFSWEELQIWLIRRYFELPERLCLLVAILFSIELILSWPKGLFRFVHKMVWKTQTFGSTNSF